MALVYNCRCFLNSKTFNLDKDLKLKLIVKSLQYFNAPTQNAQPCSSMSKMLRKELQ